MRKRLTMEDLQKLPLVKVVDHNHQPDNRSIVIPEKPDSYSAKDIKNIPGINRGGKVNPFEKYMTVEDHLQHQIVSYIDKQWPKLKYHHSPDAGRRTPFERYKYEYLGSDSGFPDLLFPELILVIELKILPNKLTDSQLEWLDFFKTIGWTAEVCYTFEEAIATIKKCLNKV